MKFSLRISSVNVTKSAGNIFCALKYDPVDNDYLKDTLKSTFLEEQRKGKSIL